MIHALNFRAVAPSRLYRCGEMAEGETVPGSTPVTLDFRLVVDLRYAAERARNPTPWRAGSPARLLIPDDDGDRATAPHMTLPDTMHERAAMLDFFSALYRELPFEETYRELFPRALRAVAESDAPVLIHCTGGKDRTGILIALIQHILGVDRDEILAEYMRTNDSADLAAIAPQLAERLTAAGSTGVTTELVSRILRVEPAYLIASLGEMARRCDSIDGYLAMLGVGADTIKGLRARLLA